MVAWIGGAWMTACAACGTALRAGAKFCDECGSPTVAAGDTPKYKQVTVLFADVVRSMDIAATLDAERYREVMMGLVERSAAVARRYGGTVEYTGDGVMALFGAPVALEDNAFRGCLAALTMQDEVNRISAELRSRDGLTVRLRVGLNSGQVIAGDVPVRARRLLAIGLRDGSVARAEARLVGRRREMAALDAIVDRAIGGRGGVVNVAGPAGIGKSRVAREVAALATGRGVEVFWAFCESHARDNPFDAVTRLLRAGSGVADLDGEAARARVRQQAVDAHPQDLLLLDDLLGIADPEVPLPQIDPDARRRRLAALIDAVSLARTEPALFIVEDAHWIDAVSESMLTAFLTVIPRTRSMVLITARPEYRGTLTRTPGAHTIALAPLGNSNTSTLLGELLGSGVSVDELAAAIAEFAAGNPFFAEKMVRELVQRGVLTGAHGSNHCGTDVAEVSVPATVQATIEARIDRLTTPAAQTLSAASVIGVRFRADLLAALGIDPVFDELVGAELVDQIRVTPSLEYAFRHPLIRAVAYESQLKSDRAQWHRRLAAAIQGAEPGSVEENAALIAEHLQAAGDAHGAYQWHMRAATWATYRDITAARQNWERARSIADGMPADEPGRATMRIAPRTMLCGTAFRVHEPVVGDRFDELRQLCVTADDHASLAIAMAGLVLDHALRGRMRQASLAASELMALVETIGDPVLSVGLSFAAIYAKTQSGEWHDMLRWSQTVIDLADGDPTRGNFSFRVTACTRRDIAGDGRLLPGPSRLARGPATRAGHGPQHGPHDLLHGRRLRLLRGDSAGCADAGRSCAGRDRGCAADRPTFRRRHGVGPGQSDTGHHAGAPPDGCRTLRGTNVAGRGRRGTAAQAAQPE